MNAPGQRARRDHTDLLLSSRRFSNGRFSTEKSPIFRVRNFPVPHFPVAPFATLPLPAFARWMPARPFGRGAERGAELGLSSKTLAP
jgi:hypothetical protein